MSIFVKDSRINIENNTKYDIVVQRYKNQKGFDWAGYATAGGYLLASIVSWIPGGGEAASSLVLKSAQKLANYSSVAAAGLGVAAGAVKDKFESIGAKIVYPALFLNSLNDFFKYGEGVKNIAPMKESFVLAPGESKYIVGSDERPGVKNGVKDIITGLTLRSEDVGLDLGRFAIDNPTVGRAKAFYASPKASSLDNVADTGSRYYHAVVPNTNLSFTFQSFDEQWDPGTKQKTMTWGLRIEQDGNAALTF